MHEGAQVVDLHRADHRAFAERYAADVGQPAVDKVPSRRRMWVLLSVGAFNVAIGALFLVDAVFDPTFRAIPTAVLMTAVGATTMHTGIRVRRSQRALLTTRLCAEGVIGEAGAMSSPAGTMCAAFHVELRTDGKKKDGLALSYCRTTSLAIELDSGGTVRVPAGSARVLRLPKQVRLGALVRADIESQLVSRVAPGRGDAYTILEYDRLYERCLQVGDRVVVENELTTVGPSGATGGGHAYRDPAGTIFAPVGVPVLRVLG